MQEYILGGYTRRENEGLKTIQFDEVEGKFSQPTLIANIGSPTYVGLSRDKSLMFAIHRGAGEENSGIVAFRRDEHNNWQEISRLLATKSSGCHVSYRESSQTVYVSNYGDGELDVYHLDENDQLHHIQKIVHTGSSVHPNQEKAHIHMGLLTPNQNTLIVCDLGTDFVSLYAIDDEGKLSLSYEYKMPDGTGPRHAVLHPAKPIVYIIGELNNTTNVLQINDDLSFTLVQTLDNVPNDYRTDAAGAAIRITEDGKFLYASSRFHDILTVFEVNEDNGLLTEIQKIGTVGQIPRDFILDQTEHYVLVPHQDSDHLSVFYRNQETGKLSFIDNATYAPECVCIALA
ncbi:lactonase family protein [Fundicoccus culcitae]|uniref:Lactonase family protein n=1 Tax=Fundicoccus culcitae TaxID=2969821 RepID=A0ABY5P5T4_9LACT|nr:lactonase family protein [Fundicoccus culcitae]UUX33970.1 lactonase family protein [Fundicoccus culcitae]